MSIVREKQVNVGLDVYLALLMLAKIRRNEQRVTIDDIADDILRKYLRERHPRLFEHQESERKREAEFIESYNT